MARGRQATKVIIDLSECGDIRALLTKNYEALYKGEGKTEQAPPFSKFMADTLLETFREAYQDELDAAIAESAKAELAEQQALAERKRQEAEQAEQNVERTRALIERLRAEGHEINLDDDDDEEEAT